MEEKGDRKKCKYTEEKREILTIAAKACAEGEKEIEEGPDLYWKKGRGVPGARSHPAKLPVCERKMLKHFLLLQSNDKQKLLKK